MEVFAPILKISGVKTVQGDNSMGAFFRRILAFLLGFIMSFVTVIGGGAAGAYWAYKNLSIDTVTDDPVVSPSVDSMTIEDFVADLQAYMSDPNSYTLGELEEKYGIDFTELFGDFASGLDEDYKNIQFLALFTGDTETLLGSINMRVVLGALPDGTLSEAAGILPVHGIPGRPADLQQPVLHGYSG